MYVRRKSYMWTSFSWSRCVSLPVVDGSPSAAVYALGDEVLYSADAQRALQRALTELMHHNAVVGDAADRARAKCAHGIILHLVLTVTADVDIF
jgi:hypothetical protein